MAIKNDLTEVAITGYKVTRFFRVDTGSEIEHPVLKRIHEYKAEQEEEE